MESRMKYEAPQARVVGRLAQVTLGGPHSQCDGHSGSVGNNGTTDPHRCG